MSSFVLPIDWLFCVKAATRDLVQRAGGLVRAGEVTGHGKSTVHRWGSTEHTDIIPIPAALLLEKETGSPMVTRAMAEIAGLRLEQSGNAPAAEFAPAFAKLAAAQAALTARCASAHADNQISTNEFLELSGLVDAVNDAGAELKNIAARESGVTKRRV